MSSSFDGSYIEVRKDHALVEVISRKPRQHAGWKSVKYKGKRYQLLGGIRTQQFITLGCEITKKDPASI
jgi:hypothetical protein